MRPALLENHHEGITAEELVAHLQAGGEPPAHKKKARYSATVLKQFNECERKYWWTYVGGLEPLPTEAQRWGTKMHKYLENWLKHGMLPPDIDPQGRAALSGLKHLPAPMTPGLRVEEEFSMGTWPGGPQITGTKDWYLAPPDDLEDEDYVANYRDFDLTLGDHKSTSNFVYALDEKSLPSDWQFIIYGERLLRKFPMFGALHGKWNYFHKTAKETKPVPALASRQHVKELWESEILPAVERVETMVRERPRLKDVPTPAQEWDEESICDAYGGCAHRSNCTGYKPRFDARATLRVIEGNLNKEKEPMSAIIAGLKSNPTKPTTSAGIPPAKAPPIIGGSKPSPVAAVPQSPTTPAPAQPNSLAASIASKARELGQKAVGLAAGKPAVSFHPQAVNPPVDPVALAAALPIEDEKERDKAQGDDISAEIAPPLPQEAAKKARGKKAAPVATAELQVQATGPTPDSGTNVKVVSEKIIAEGKAARVQNFWLWIDARPYKGAATEPKLLEDFVAPVKVQLAAEQGVAHWRELDFDKAKRYLNAALDKKLAAEPLTGSWYVESRSPTFEACSDVLQSRASVVVRGHAP